MERVGGRFLSELLTKNPQASSGGLSLLTFYRVGPNFIRGPWTTSSIWLEELIQVKRFRLFKRSISVAGSVFDKAAAEAEVVRAQHQSSIQPLWEALDPRLHTASGVHAMPIVSEVSRVLLSQRTPDLALMRCYAEWRLALTTVLVCPSRLGSRLGALTECAWHPILF